MAHPRSPSADFNILGNSKTSSFLDVGKAYKSLVRKWNPEKNHSSSEAAKNEGSNNPNIHHHPRDDKGDDPTTTASSRGGSSHKKRHSSVDESFFSPSVFSKSSSRRSAHTPGTQTPLSRSASRSTTPTTPARDFPTSLSKTWSQRSTTPPSENPSLSRINTARRSTTPIVFSQSTTPKKPQPIEKKLACTLEELCDGCVKKIKITRDVIAASTGTISQEEETLKIKVKPGWRKGTKITFEGKGDEKPGTLPADIIFSIDEKRHPLFKREGDDLQLGVEIPLVQALTGCTVSVPLLGGEKMCLCFDDIIQPGYERTIQGQGMPKPKGKGARGDLKLKFLIKFPTRLSDDQRADACNILQDTNESSLSSSSSS